MKKNEKEKTSEKLTTPLSARSSYNTKKKTFIHVIPKESKTNLLNNRKDLNLNDLLYLYYYLYLFGLYYLFC